MRIKGDLGKIENIFQTFTSVVSREMNTCDEPHQADELLI